MLVHHRVIAFLCFSLLLVSIATAESNSNKPIRTQQRHVKLSTVSGIKGRGSSSVASGGRATDSKDSKIASKTKPISLFNLKLAATAVKDEVIDIVESIVFAENSSERLENTIDIIRRHKLLLTAGSAALVLKTQIGGKG